MGNAKFEAAIAAMNTQRERSGVAIEGRLYSRVKDRVELFRKEWGDEYGIDTSVDVSQGFSQGAPIVAQAKILKNNQVMASGWAVEFVGTNDYTMTSPVEVAETSAIGRALACFGLHGGEYASSNEITAKNHPDGEWRVDLKVNEPGNGPDPRKQVQQEPEQFRQSNFYMPPESNGGYQQPEQYQGPILDQIDRINSRDELGRYWHTLKPYMQMLKVNSAFEDLAAEIKASFATANAEMEGR